MDDLENTFEHSIAKFEPKARIKYFLNSTRFFATVIGTVLAPAPSFTSPNFLAFTAWCESMGKQVANGTLIALGVLVGGAGGMWLLFWFVEKMGGRGRLEFTPHSVEDVGPIDRMKNHAFAAQELENMRKETPNWNAHVHDAFDSVQFGDTNPLDNI